MANSHLQDEVKEYVASKVAVYKQLAHVEFVESVPKSAAGAATSTLFYRYSHFVHVSQLFANPHTACGILYLVSCACWVLIGPMFYQFTSSGKILRKELRQKEAAARVAAAKAD